ncbi:RHS repeat-associated core domain-containing protein [Micromonospora sp. NPDC050980]|uniref:RHS repeat-associated core domain-containing protein n=1 Tax=Micromonospora sp. NPDC050980 TaxID=3155161 RepID=UPI0033FB4EFF
MATVLIAGLLWQAPGSAGARPGWQPPKGRDVTGVPVTKLKHATRPAWTAAGREARAGKVSWPSAGRAEVDLNALSAAAARAGDGGARAGTLPIWVTAAGTQERANRSASVAPPGRVTVEVADRVAAARAGVAGLVAKVGRSDGLRAGGDVRLEVDYSGFAGAYGGDWASRLRVVSLPDGAVLPGRNDLRNSRVSATVPLSATGAATTFAVTAGPSGDNGDYGTTSLSAAGTWQVSQQTGAFSWSYPMNKPPAMGGPEPSMGFSYNSGAVDGLSGGTNTQGSWIGDGWDMWPGYVERKFRSCADDKTAIRGGEPNNKLVNSGDQCWYKPEGNATISLNGQATELVPSSGGLWKGEADDGSKIELKKDSSFANGDNDNEYWKVTKTDGTQYFFGRNHGVGGASAATATNSVWTAPVYGNHPDEPGYVAGNYAASRTTQAWRWNLDYVVDPQGNTLTYYYGKEEGAYGREGNKDKRTTYDRGGWLSKIEYGSRSDAPSTTYAAARILFDVADRCASNCWSGADPVKASWLDTPWDQYCKATPCTDQLSPTFWTAKRLSRVRTQVYSGSGGTYDEVEWWTLRHSYLQSGDNEGKPMWLAGITRTGKVTSAGGTEVSDPEVVFDPGAEALANRVDGMADGRSDLFRYRIQTITTESGAQISVTYSPKECTRGSTPLVHANTKRCYPAYYGPKGEEPTLDWFHKYRVDRVDVYDNTGGFTHEQTNYDYLDQPAWHYDDSELTEPKKRTWGEFRGYGKVRVRKGLESGVQSATEYLYFRGMDGDKQPSGTRSVDITDSQNTKVIDEDPYAGMVREETTLLGAGGSWLASTISTPVKQGPTASSGNLKSFMAATGTVRSRMKLADGSTRWTKTVTTYNSDNLPTSVDDLGDESTAADDRCTRTWYARNGTAWILDLAKKTETVGVNCAATPTLPADMLSSTRTTYDSDTNDWNTYLPVYGNVAKVEEIDSWTGAAPNWATVGRTKHDPIGRVKESYDALGRLTKTDYTPASGGPVTSVKITNPLSQSSTATYAPAWHLPTALEDPNGLRSDLTYDGLGRLRQVWLPGRLKSSHLTTPDKEYFYDVRNTAPSAVTAKTLLPSTTASYHTTITLYDGLLRARQIQTQAPGGGRVLTDTVYDSRGLLDWTSQPYYDTTNTAPNKTLVGSVGTPAVPALTENVYDGAGRLTDAIFKVGVDTTQNEKWRTTTTYAGERTSVLPPLGGVASTRIVDGRGQTVALRQYKDRAQVGSDNTSTFDEYRYGYTDRGELAGVTDPVGNTWRYSYDQRGRKASDDDPDRGSTSYTYNLAGELLTSKDARQKTLVYAYDVLGRKKAVREESTTGKLRAEWSYDTLPYGIGKLTKSVRYEPAGSTNAYVNEVVAYDTSGRPKDTRISVPATEGGLCASNTLTPCSYDYTTTYRPDGQVATATLPAAGGLASEKLIYTYNDVGLPNGQLSAAQIYVNQTSYTKLGTVLQTILGATGKRTWVTNTNDQNTGRLTNSNAIPELKPEVFNFTYHQDPSGNVDKITDTPANGAAETQCYSYDYLSRLTDAWTPSSGDCGGARSAAALGGPAPYWHAYTYTAGTDNRRTETSYEGGQRTRTYSYLPQGQGTGSHPHAVEMVETTGTVTKTENYTYDETGNTKTRPGPSGPQNLTWDHEGRLFSVADNSGSTSYVYDADGNRLVRRDPTGATLYLPGGTEVRKPTSAAAAGTRYYAHVAGAVAVRDSTGRLDWIVSDHHGTAEATIRNSDLTVARRRSLPFGADRGTSPSGWPTVMDKGFVGGTEDNTGLTHLGAREYDSALGSFISLDPIMDMVDPQQWHGYAYSHHNPATRSDPSGLIDADCAVIKGGCPDYQPGNEQGNQEQKKKSRCWPARCTGNSGGGGDEDPFDPDTWTDKMPDGRKVPAKGNMALPVWTQVVYGKHVSSLTAVELERARTDVLCYNYPDVCQGIIDELWSDVGNLLGELTGVNDAVDCAHGSASGCAWTVIGLIPIGKLKGAGKVGEALLDGGKVLCSFTPDTKVLMADGTAKPLSDIRVGDKVLATDPQTGRTGPEVVTHIWIHEDALQDLEVDGHIVTTTGDHPFWNARSGLWQRADALPRDARLSTTTRRLLSVGSLDSSKHVGLAYNLTVNGPHTYYVIAGTTPVLVHNTCGDGLDDVSRNIANHANGEALRPNGDGTHFVRGVDPKALGHYVDGVINGNVPNVRTRYLRNGRVGYWDPDKRAVVIEDGDAGTVFTPRGGEDWFDNILK